MRAVVEGTSELGRLANDFNHMMATIQKQDKELRGTRDLLEERVCERAMSMEQEIAEWQRAEHLVRESEELFRALNEAAPGGFGQSRHSSVPGQKSGKELCEERTAGRVLSAEVKQRVLVRSRWRYEGWTI